MLGVEVGRGHRHGLGWLAHLLLDLLHDKESALRLIFETSWVLFFMSSIRDRRHWRDMLELHLAGDQLLTILVLCVVLVMFGLLVHMQALLSFSVQAHQNLTAVQVELFARGLGVQAN